MEGSCYGRLVFPQQKQTEASGTPAPEDPPVRADQDSVVEEALGSPLAMWELEVQNIELEKGEGGLGFSILDYQVRTRLSRRRQASANACAPDRRRTLWTPPRR